VLLSSHAVAVLLVAVLYAAGELVYLQPLPWRSRSCRLAQNGVEQRFLLTGLYRLRITTNRIKSLTYASFNNCFILVNLITKFLNTFTKGLVVASVVAVPRLCGNRCLKTV
jgi:hypothetical protein